MTKFILMIWVCSFLGENMCMAPVKSPVLYDSWYECSRAAHKESLKILSKIGYAQVNKGKVATRYTCTETSSI